MSRLPPRSAFYLAFLVLGVYAQVAQALLIRESLVAFYGNELSLGAFFGSWLLWVAVGSIAATRWRGRGAEAIGALRAVLLLLPLLLILELLLFRSVRWVLSAAAGELVPFGELLGTTLVLNVPTGLAIGLAFPLAVQGLRAIEADPTGADTRGAVRAASVLYALDALGAFAGGVLFTFVLVDWLGPWRTASAGMACLGLAVAVLSPGARASRVAGVAGLLVGTVLALPGIGRVIDHALERWRFASLQPGLELVAAVETRYQHAALARLGPQYSLVSDGRVETSFPDPDQVRQDAAYFYAQSGAARRALLLGGVASGLAAELLRYPLERLVVVQPDAQAFARVRPHLPAETLAALADPRLELRFEDGRRYANTLTGGEGFDLVLVLAGDPSTAHNNRYYTAEFYAAVRRGMAPGAVLCTAVGGASNYLGREVQGYGASVLRTLGSAFAHLALMPGDVQVFCASEAPGRVTEDPAVLEQRYLAAPLDVHSFPALVFHSLLPADRIAFVRQQLADPPGELNTDERPVTYWLNMLLWGKFSASQFVAWLERLRGLGPWPYLVPAAVLVALLLLRGGMEAWPRPRLRREAATLALAALGFVGMAAQLALLFSYQATVGFMFGRIALLNGVFMTGLALGSGWVGRVLSARAGPALMGVLGLSAAGMAAAPSVLRLLGGLDGTTLELAYLGLCLAVGVLTGTGFPLGVERTQRDTGSALRSSAVAEWADSLGGAAGGLVTGALLVPTLGVAGTAHLLAALVTLALVPLLVAEKGADRIEALAARGHRAFPWSGLAWALGFVLVTGWLLELLVTGAAPGPRVRFDAETLATVGGTADYDARSEPFPHYLGTGPEGRRVVALATAAVAGDVRGYGGPINLLVAFDEAGTLRGTRYLDSKETPSYIVDIDRWLSGLVGQSLAAGPLTLDRVDALSGATLTSRAALEGISRTARAVGQAAFGRTFGAAPSPRPPPWRQPAFVATVLLLLAFFPVWQSGRDWLRVLYQLAALGVLGLWLNTPLTEIDLINLSLGQVAGLADNPQRWLLVGFAALTTVLLGPVWCGYVCPFGALQELIGRLGRRLGLRAYPDRPVETRVRFLKYLLLAAVLLGAWWSGESRHAAFDPMQHVFAGRWAGWIGAIAVVTLLAALVYYRFWCRYFCPVGAFLNLGNKLALLQRLGPMRRFEHCDLGVTDDFDVDCIRCHRCVDAVDVGLPHHLPARAPAKPILGKGRR
jgi:predicted membrane-bound spermidine synthase